MEDEKKINWLSLFIKIVIAFAFILIIVWLVSKLINRNKLSDTFKNNINNMETVAVKYFKDIDLPVYKSIFNNKSNDRKRINRICQNK